MLKLTYYKWSRTCPGLSDFAYSHIHILQNFASGHGVLTHLLMYIGVNVYKLVKKRQWILYTFCECLTEKWKHQPMIDFEESGKGI